MWRPSFPEAWFLRILRIPAAFAVLLLLSCAAPQGKSSEPKASAKEESAAAAETPEAAQEEVSLGEVPDAVARLEVLHEEIEKALVVDADERRVPEDLNRVQRRVDRSRERLARQPLDELAESARRLEASEATVALDAAVVASRLRRVEEHAREVGELKATFESYETLAKRAAAPRQLIERIASCRARLNLMSLRLDHRRTEVLVLVDNLAEARGGVAAMRAMTASRLVEVRRKDSVEAEAPIWELQVSTRQALTETAEHLRRDGRRIARWAGPSLFRIVAVALLSFGGVVVVLERRRRRLARGEALGGAGGRAILINPWAAAIPVTVMAVVALSPQTPRIVIALAWFLAAPAAAFVIVRMLGTSVARTVWVLAGSLALAPVAAVVGALPLAQRVVLILQTLPLAVALALDLSRGRMVELVNFRGSVVLRMMGWLLVGGLLVATAGCILGWVGLASILTAGALGTLGGAIVILASYLVLSVVLQHALTSRVAIGLNMIREHGRVVAATTLNVLRMVSVLAVVVVAIRAFGVRPAIQSLLQRFFAAEATFGTISISAGAISSFVLGVFIAVLLARLAAFVLEAEILTRFEIRRGTAHAVSATTRYVIVFAGFLLAAGAAGIDLTRMGFLAGALGVGIGFGLQNIVSNFISGLILLFERPIQVGDTVEVTGATGNVTQIGIRASTVHTFEGAEVIVPNADLISKPVTNWTRTHEDRRFDVPIGVAYGSSLEQTAQALLEAARRTGGVLASPRPEALFRSFGPSALEWVLRVWMRMDESPGILSELKCAMSEEMARAGIEIPLPQRDLHIRSVAPVDAESLVVDSARLSARVPAASSGSADGSPAEPGLRSE